jgi:hypothetical protein
MLGAEKRGSPPGIYGLAVRCFCKINERAESMYPKDCVFHFPLVVTAYMLLLPVINRISSMTGCMSGPRRMGIIDISCAFECIPDKFVTTIGRVNQPWFPLILSYIRYQIFNRKADITPLVSATVPGSVDRTTCSSNHSFHLP